MKEDKKVEITVDGTWTFGGTLSEVEIDVLFKLFDLLQGHAIEEFNIDYIISQINYKHTKEGL